MHTPIACRRRRKQRSKVGQRNTATMVTPSSPHEPLHDGGEPSVPPNSIWSNGHLGSPLEEQDDRVSLLRMPPPANDGFDEDYGLSNEEKKDDSDDKDKK